MYVQFIVIVSSIVYFTLQCNQIEFLYYVHNHTGIYVSQTLIESCLLDAHT